MITLKSLGRKLRKLEASMQKDAKRLSKLIRKIEKAGASEASRKPRIRAAVEKPKKTATTAQPAKAKRNLTPEGRAKLSAAMNARWAAKRAAAAVSPQPSDAPVSASATPASDGTAP